MTVFCDTSVLVAACIRQHPHYGRARPLLETIASGKERGVISAHSLAEAFSALTSVPVAPRILPSEAMEIIATNIERHFALVAATPEMYARAVAARSTMPCCSSAPAILRRIGSTLSTFGTSADWPPTSLTASPRHKNNHTRSDSPPDLKTGPAPA
jgi:predicted nucleic acid-binding protein